MGSKKGGGNPQEQKLVSKIQGLINRAAQNPQNLGNPGCDLTRSAESTRNPQNPRIQKSFLLMVTGKR